MALSIREQVIQAFQARLSTLTDEGCYRAVPYIDEDDFVALWDDEEEAISQAFNRWKYSLPLAVVYSKRYTDDDSASKLSEMLAELIVAVNSPDDDLGGLAEAIQYSGSSVKHREAGGEFISVGALFTVEYCTRAGDPFTQ